jgi:hypothetical protein
MTAKKEIELSSDVKDLLEAISNPDAAKSVDLEAVKSLMDTLGLAVVAKGISEAKERISRKSEVAKYASSTKLNKDDAKAIREFVKAFEKAPIIDAENPRALDQEEKDALVEVELTRRKVEDIVKGLYQRDRDTGLNHLTFVNDGDPYAVGNIVSVKHGYKVAVHKTERVGAPNYAALKEVVDEEVWKEIVSEEVSVTYTVDENKVAQAMAEGKITLDQFAALVPEKKISRVFSVKPLKEGDKV